MTIPDLALKIIVLFGIGLSESNQAVLVSRLGEVAKISSTALAEIEKLVTSLEEITASIMTSADKAGLIQADDLRWAPGGRLSGLHEQKADLKARLSQLLDLAFFSRGSGQESLPSNVFKVIRG